MLQLTEAAAEAVKRALAEEGRPETDLLRVRIKGGGCSGLSYELSFESASAPADRILEQHGARIVLDPKSELYLSGTELDHSSGLQGQGFVFRNPEAKGTCGCGKSFAA
jgi:iron-sulfur cluster assembly protein